jgi:hypothetical protein
MNQNIAELIDQLETLPADWHGAGTVDTTGLRAIAKYAETIGPISHSVETGSGKTTLLFSHLSADHRVFAVDMGNSISQVRKSPLFRSENVTYVEGPTQVTLPGYPLPDKVQIALIDGPHGYPFPDLEYFYFYPIIETGGLLLVDDIPIPSIGRMFEIIKADDMFDLVEIVNNNLAVFRRTHEEMIDPHSDSWWLQGYNRAHYKNMAERDALVPVSAAVPPSLFDTAARSVVRQALRGASALTPKALKGRVPDRIKERLWNKM